MKEILNWIEVSGDLPGKAINVLKTITINTRMYLLSVEILKSNIFLNPYIHPAVVLYESLFSALLCGEIQPCS